MTKKVLNINKCKDCYWCIPDMTNLSFASKGPIMGTCKYNQYKFLLNGEACESFKKNPAK